MESTINRKDYRRNSYEGYESVSKEKKISEHKSNIFINQIISSLLILLAILLLKFFDFNDEFELVKNTFNSGIPYEILENKIIEQLKMFNKENNSVIQNDNVENNNIININLTSEEINNTSGENNEVSGEYISAVEGINKLVDDASEIKENYEIISPLDGIITSRFGCRESDNPIVSSYHAGLDIAANTGTNIIAAHDGEILLAGVNGTYGKCVIIASGDLKTVYAHCSDVLVKVGEKINKGDTIAKVGMTGNATGPHLHFEIRYKERFVNPEDVI